MAPPLIDPRADLKDQEEFEEEMDDAPDEEPVKDWFNNLNKFKTLGRDFSKLKAPDLEDKNPMERLALSSWRAHVYDVASAFDAIINPTVFERAMRQLKPEHTEELMPHIDNMYMSLGQPRGSRELECEELYGLCTSYQGGNHTVAPPIYDIETLGYTSWVIRRWPPRTRRMWRCHGIPASGHLSATTFVATPCGGRVSPSSTRA